MTILVVVQDDKAVSLEAQKVESIILGEFLPLSNKDVDFWKVVELEVVEDFNDCLHRDQFRSLMVCL